MNKRLRFKDIEKIDVVAVIVIILLLLFYVDFFDLNERYGFPINILDEPLILIIGILLGYLLAKFRLKRIFEKI